VTTGSTSSDLERTLLLELLGQPKLSDAELHRMAAAADWSRVLALAGGNLQPMLAFRVIERDVHIPAAASQELQTARRASAVMVTQRLAVLRQVLPLLEQAHIPFLALKGLSLAWNVYPSPETRVMGDLDLWVRADSLRTARTLLEPLGWHTPWWHQTQAHLTGDGDSISLRRHESALMLELHRRPASLVETMPDGLDECWSHQRTIQVAGFTMPVLSVENQILHLCVHLARHHRFIAAVPRLLDLTLVVREAGEHFDWNHFAARCRRHGVTGWVATSLGAAHTMLGAQVPPYALAAMGVPDLDRLCGLAVEQAWVQPRPALRPQSVMAGATTGARLRRMVRRLGELLTGHGSGLAGLRPDLLFRRLRVAAQFNLPALVRALRNRDYRGASGDLLRRLSAENQQLYTAMYDTSRHAGR